MTTFTNAANSHAPKSSNKDRNGILRLCLQRSMIRAWWFPTDQSTESVGGLDVELNMDVLARV